MHRGAFLCNTIFTYVLILNTVSLPSLAVSDKSAGNDHSKSVTLPKFASLFSTHNKDSRYVIIKCNWRKAACM